MHNSLNIWTLEPVLSQVRSQPHCEPCLYANVERLPEVAGDMTSRVTGRGGNPSVECTSLRPQAIPVLTTRCRSAVKRFHEQLINKYGYHRTARSPVLTYINVTERFAPSVFTANIRGGFAQKSDELFAVIQENAVDIGVITETWLKETVPTGVVSIPGYVVHGGDRRDGRCRCDC